MTLSEYAHIENKEDREKKKQSTNKHTKLHIYSVFIFSLTHRFHIII